MVNAAYVDCVEIAVSLKAFVITLILDSLCLQDAQLVIALLGVWALQLVGHVMHPQSTWLIDLTVVH